MFDSNQSFNIGLAGIFKPLCKNRNGALIKEGTLILEHFLLFSQNKQSDVVREHPLFA